MDMAKDLENILGNVEDFCGYFLVMDVAAKL
jgi:hypothetical protein